MRPESQAVPDFVLDLDDIPGQDKPKAEEDEQGPLPAERIEGHAEDEPPDQLEVREEVEWPGGRRRLQEPRHVDPALHPELARPC